MMKTPFLILERFRILCSSQTVYDEKFHEGVNIIRGDNGTGKSTIADFIFYALGGQFEDWKEEARRCDEVQAEIRTPSGHLVLKRRIAGRLEPIDVFFGAFDDAKKSALDGWETFPIQRTSSGGESFSQVMFRSLGIPEAQSEGASNVTMHQILRACYSDQRTPASRYFRFESWDTQTIRQAVGDLICGISGYKLYEIELKLRSKEQEYTEVFQEYSALLKALPQDEIFSSAERLSSKLNELQSEQQRLIAEIAAVDNTVEPGQVKEFASERKNANEQIQSAKNKIEQLEARKNTIDFELREIGAFDTFLLDLLGKLSGAESMQEAIGAIEFTYCPACGNALSASPLDHVCILCKQAVDDESSKSKYNHIRLDIEIQARETKQLLNQKTSEFERVTKQLRVYRRQYESELASYETKFAGGNGPREAYLAQRLSRVGYIDSETAYLARNLEVANLIQELSKKKEILNNEIGKLKTEKSRLESNAGKRRSAALSSISDIGVKLLHADIPTQEEFQQAKDLRVNFRDDAISVDGKMNFAESSNVYLKNSAVLATFLAAGFDHQFYHPRFLLMDNMEDKGMQERRSRNAQKVLVENVTEIPIPYQVIYTTSMMNPELELDDYVVGPAYTTTRKTLDFGKRSESDEFAEI